jgi:hypothetical protein
VGRGFELLGVEPAPPRGGGLRRRFEHMFAV